MSTETPSSSGPARVLLVIPTLNDPAAISYQLVPGPGPALFLRLVIGQIPP